MLGQKNIRRVDLVKSFRFTKDRTNFSQDEKVKLNGPTNQPVRLAFLFFSAIQEDVFAELGQCNASRLIKEFQDSHECKKFASIFMKACRSSENDEGDSSVIFDYFVTIDKSFLQRLKDVGSAFILSFERRPEVRSGNAWTYWDSSETKLKREIRKSNFDLSSNSNEITYELFKAKDTRVEPDFPNSNYVALPAIRLSFELNISIEVQIDTFLDEMHKTMMVLPIQLNGNFFLQSLFEKESTKDFAIVAADGMEIRCHRLILAGHSDVFDVMLSSEMKEGTSGVTQFDDMSGEGVTQLIRYFYGLEIIPTYLSCETASELFQAAHKYKLKQLGESIGNLLLCKEGKWFTTDAALELYFFTDKLGPDFEHLNKWLFNVLSRFPSDDLKSSQRFNELQPTQAVDLMMKLMDELNIRK